MHIVCADMCSGLAAGPGRMIAPQSGERRKCPVRRGVRCAEAAAAPTDAIDALRRIPVKKMIQMGR